MTPGTAGGFFEKIEAAENCGCRVLVIARPTHEDGLTMDEVKALLRERWESK